MGRHAMPRTPDSLDVEVQLLHRLRRSTEVDRAVPDEARERLLAAIDGYVKELEAFVALKRAALKPSTRERKS